KFAVPGLTIFADQRRLQKLVNRHLKFFSKRTRWRTNMPLVIVERFKVLFGSNADRIQMTADRLFPVDLAVEICLFNPALQNSGLVVNSVNAFTPVDHRRTQLTFIVNGMGTL